VKTIGDAEKNQFGSSQLASTVVGALNSTTFARFILSHRRLWRSQQQQ